MELMLCKCLYLESVLYTSQISLTDGIIQHCVGTEPLTGKYRQYLDTDSIEDVELSSINIDLSLLTLFLHIAQVGLRP